VSFDFALRTGFGIKEHGLGNKDQGTLYGLRGEDGDADRAVRFQFTAGALHFDKAVGRKLQADATERLGTSREVFAVPALKRVFEIGAD